jgi:FMN-dependent oxidoreductase (nitrilotriacetate monooxygenase family)
MSNLNKIILNCHVVGVGQNPIAWRCQNDTKAFINRDFYHQIATTAERGMFDAIFLSDSLSLHGHAYAPSQMLDPLVVASIISSFTKNIGIICTASTTFNEPFNLARQFLSLDHMSSGRVGWNAVTTYNPSAAANFGAGKLPNSSERYARAEEFIDVVKKLWMSWSKDALVLDSRKGVFADPNKVNKINHNGKYFSVDGPLNVPRSVQNRPLLIQSGASEAGLELAAKHADVIFTAQNDFIRAKQFYQNLKLRVKNKGRDAEKFKILPGLYPVLGSTLAEATKIKNERDELRNINGDMEFLSRQLAIHVEDLSEHKQLPYSIIEKSSRNNKSKGFSSEIVSYARQNRLTVRELILNNFGMHRMLVCTPEILVSDMEMWFSQKAADGFNINFGVFPQDLNSFVDHVIPLLQKKHLFRNEYGGATIKDNFGISQVEG